MTDLGENDAGWDDVESLVRAAGSYVRPSEDLRPRVLETARAESNERRAQRRMWQLALVVALLGAFSTATGSRWEAAAPPPGMMLEAASLAHRAETGDAGCSDAAWNMVESFTDLRRRQAALLRLTR